MRCSKCGAENPDRAKFCEECASPFTRRCPSCDTENSLTARFCIECAKPLERARGKPSATKFGLFTELAKGALSAEEIQHRIGLHPRSARDFPDALVALGMLERNGTLYSNTRDTDFYL